MKAKRKVLFVSDSLSNGGAERQLTLLIKYLPKEWLGKLWTLDDGTFLQVIQGTGIPTVVNRRKFRYDIMPFLRMWAVIRNEHPDVVHSSGWMSTFASGPICKALGIPLVDSAIRSGMRMPRQALIASRWADAVIANSKAGMQCSQMDPNRVRVIYNGFDPERLRLCQTDDSSQPAGRSTVVMTARMVREKDYAAFLSAARALYQKESGAWCFWAIGAGPDRENLISCSSDLIEAGCFAFPEAGMEVLGYVRQATIGVLLTNTRYHAEGISNSIMEYMACGLPVICYRSGGNEEIVTDGVTGFVVDPGDTDTLIGRLIYLHTNPDVARKMGQSGKERLLKDFSIEKMVTSVVCVYEAVLSKKSSLEPDLPKVDTYD